MPAASWIGGSFFLKAGFVALKPGRIAFKMDFAAVITRERVCPPHVQANAWPTAIKPRLTARTMHLDLPDLRLFIHIAESPSLTQAAKRAHLSLAAVSVRIKSLENQANTRLLYRDNRGMELTPAGQKFLQHARIILGQVDHLKSDFQEQLAGDSGHIRIFANTTAVTEFMHAILARFLAAHPGVTVDLLAGTVDVGHCARRSGRIDQLGDCLGAYRRARIANDSFQHR